MTIYLAEIVRGIEPLARKEIEQALRPTHVAPDRDGLRFEWHGDERKLRALSLTQSVSRVLRFDVPRPKALLGDQHFRALVGAAQDIVSQHPRGAFRSVHLAAAGADSAVMQRLLSELARALSLIPQNDQGDLTIRLRSDKNANMWEALVRLMPRPLATRTWRVCNYEGALNATVARAMALLTQPRADDVFVNGMCGSATLMLERAACGAARQIVGCDVSDVALHCAAQNSAAFANSRHTPIQLEKWDATQMPLADASADALCADLPFGNLVGSHADNLMLYPRVLHEAARVLRPQARAVLITHEIKLLTRVLQSQSALWKVEQQIPIVLRGLHPQIFVLRRC